MVKTLHKKVDIARNRLVIPKYIIDKWGMYFKMIIYKDKIVLKPEKK